MFGVVSKSLLFRSSTWTSPLPPVKSWLWKISFRESPGQCLLYAESRDSQAYDFTMKVQNKVLHVFGYVVVQIIQPILIIDLKDTKGKYKVVQVQHKSKCENSEWLEEGVVDFEGKIGWEEISVWLEGE